MNPAEDAFPGAPSKCRCDEGFSIDICIQGEGGSCDDGNACTIDVCSIDQFGVLSCTNTPNDALCNDGLFCNGEETCDAVSGCQAGTPPDCGDDLAFCNGTESCDEDGDTCVSSGDPCGDDGVDCTIDACNDDTDSCDHTPDDSYCDDDDFCTEDSCDTGSGCVYDELFCGDVCFTTGSGRAKPPKTVLFGYDNTLPAPDTGTFDVACITVENPREGQLFNGMVADGDTFIVGAQKKLNPELYFWVCPSDGEECLSTSEDCDYFEVHTSCSQPFEINQKFGSGENGIIEPQDPPEANGDGEIILAGQIN